MNYKYFLTDLNIKIIEIAKTILDFRGFKKVWQRRKVLKTFTMWDPESIFQL